MFDSEARAFLERVFVARLATIGSDGYPHAIPLWYLLRGEEILLISERATQKVKNLQVT
jgi:nitroimidazol reductase NimA-like FMN-containing flavoprotein (pyridoxamine 5'-phosphate oxidase superfamily)